MALTGVLVLKRVGGDALTRKKGGTDRGELLGISVRGVKEGVCVSVAGPFSVPPFHHRCTRMLIGRRALSKGRIPRQWSRKPQFNKTKAGSCRTKHPKGGSHVYNRWAGKTTSALLYNFTRCTVKVKSGCCQAQSHTS